MFTATQLQKRPAAFQRLTGVTPEEFDNIAEAFEPLWDEAEIARLNNRKRKRAIGAGPTFKLEVAAQILMTLIYLRQYCTQEFLGWLIFGLNRSNVCRNIQLILPVLEQALPGPIRAKTLKEFLEQFPEFDTVIVDATEQERAQPKAAKKQENGKKAVGRPKKQRKFFSGKTKMHALKTQIAVTPDGLIVHQSATVPGPMADSMLLRRARLMVNLPTGTRVIWDAGYVGMEKIYPEFEVVTPFKRKKGQDLTEDEREFNHQVSKVRIVVENVICRMKLFRMLGDFFRNSDSVHGLMTGVVSGLVNLRTINRLAVIA